MSTKIRHVNLLVLFLLATIPAWASEERTWTDVEGRKMVATLIDYSDGFLTLKTQQGKVVRVSREKFCDDDWLYVSSTNPDILYSYERIVEVSALQTAPNRDYTEKPLSFFFGMKNSKVHLLTRYGNNVISEVPYAVSEVSFFDFEVQSSGEFYSGNIVVAKWKKDNTGKIVLQVSKDESSALNNQFLSFDIHPSSAKTLKHIMSNSTAALERMLKNPRMNRLLKLREEKDIERRRAELNIKKAKLENDGEPIGLQNVKIETSYSAGDKITHISPSRSVVKFLKDDFSEYLMVLPGLNCRDDGNQKEINLDLSINFSGKQWLFLKRISLKSSRGSLDLTPAPIRGADSQETRYGGEKDEFYYFKLDSEAVRPIICGDNLKITLFGESEISFDLTYNQACALKEILMHFDRLKQ